MFQRGTPLAKPLIFISFSLLPQEKDFRFRPGSPFSFDRNGIDPQVRRRADAFPPCHAGKLGFVGIAKGFPLGGRLWCGADCRGLPLGGKLSAKQTDEGAGLGWLSIRRHLIRPFGPPSPQGEGFTPPSPPPWRPWPPPFSPSSAPFSPRGSAAFSPAPAGRGSGARYSAQCPSLPAG